MNKEESKEIPFWKMTADQLLNHYETDRNGYNDDKVAKLKEIYPLNELEEKEKETILEKILEQFQDKLVKILLGAAIVSFIIALTSDHDEGMSAYIEPFVILLILIANATIGVWQDINADKAIDALKKIQASTSNVKRNGKIIKIEARDLLPGDIVIVSEGDKVPADMRLIDVHTSNFEVSEASLTGESVSSFKISEPIERNDKPGLREMKNVIFSSSGVIIGCATGIVVNIGMDTEIGMIHKCLNEVEDEKSPLKQKLEEFGDYLSTIIGAICIIVWAIHYKNFFDDIHGGVFNGMIYYFKISVALAVAAIPEGLPAVITTCLALGSRRMSANKAIVRKLDSIETLGCTNVICSDKTGTLTTNNMSVTKFMIIENEGQEGVIKEVEGTSFNPIGEVKGIDKSYFRNSKPVHLTAAVSSICNMSSIKNVNGTFEVTGSPTEGALKVFTEKLRTYDESYIQKSNINDDPMEFNKHIKKNYKVLFTLEFDRNRKAMSVLALKDNKPILLTKGAPEVLLNQAKHYYSKEGKLCNFNENYRTTLLNQVNADFTSKSLRSLALFVREDLPMLNNIDLNDSKALREFFKNRDNVIEIEQNLTLVSIIGMLDPPRPEVKNAIYTCHDAGIRVIMITGDNKNTAESIAVEIGLIDNVADLKKCSYTTESFFKLPLNGQKEVLQNNHNMIFSRSEPKHKMELVKLLKQLNCIVAMTGDGVNDAPALAESNIGVAMGISGTEVAKEASDIVLADDNFATIVKAVEEGRSIYMNMKAFIRYLISSNIGEVVSIFVCSFFGIPEAFTSIQLLWVNLVTDGPPATALGFNPPEENIMLKPPRSNDDPLLSRWVIFRYFVIGTYVGISTIGIFVYWYLYFNHTDGHTLISWKELTTWTECSKWENFKVNNFSGIVLKNPCEYFTIGKRKAVTLSLTVLVVIEMFNAMNAISDEASLLTMPPNKNKWLILAIFSSLTLHCVILYIPFFNNIFSIMPLDTKEWLLVIIFSFPVVLLDEMVKFYTRLTGVKKKSKIL